MANNNPQRGVLATEAVYRAQVPSGKRGGYESHFRVTPGAFAAKKVATRGNSTKESFLCKIMRDKILDSWNVLDPVRTKTRYKIEEISKSRL